MVCRQTLGGKGENKACRTSQSMQRIYRPPQRSTGNRNEEESSEGRQAPAKKAKPARKAKPAKKAGKPADRPRQQEGRGNRHDEARQGRDPGGNHESNGLAESYGSRPREHPRMQRRSEGKYSAVVL